MPIIIKFDLYRTNGDKIGLASVRRIKPNRAKPCLRVGTRHSDRAINRTDCQIHAGNLASINTGTECAADGAETVNRIRQSVEIGDKPCRYKIIGSDINKEIAAARPPGKIRSQTATCILASPTACCQESSNAGSSISGHADSGISENKGSDARLLMRQRHPAGADSQTFKSVGREIAAIFIFTICGRQSLHAFIKKHRQRRRGPAIGAADDRQLKAADGDLARHAGDQRINAKGYVSFGNQQISIIKAHPDIGGMNINRHHARPESKAGPFHRHLCRAADGGNPILEDLRHTTKMQNIGGWQADKHHQQNEQGRYGLFPERGAPVPLDAVSIAQEMLPRNPVSLVL